MKINEQIKCRKCRVIGEHGEQLGIMPTYEALKLSREQRLDLIEVSPNSNPPVCRIMKYPHTVRKTLKSKGGKNDNPPPSEPSLSGVKPKVNPPSLSSKAKAVDTKVNQEVNEIMGKEI